MPKGKIYSSTGSAQVKKTGQTASGKHGSGTGDRAKMRGSVKDLNIK